MLDRFGELPEMHGRTDEDVGHVEQDADELIASSRATPHANILRVTHPSIFPLFVCPALIWLNPRGARRCLFVRALRGVAFPGN